MISTNMGELLVGEYLLRRVHELGVRDIFGVPGGTLYPPRCFRVPLLTDFRRKDYELAFLDLVLQSSMKWRGSPNELVGVYAADGYARVNGVGCLVTTFGPGETSALCGIAGAYAEFVPVIHIVGYPSMKAQRAHAILHHTLGEGKFEYVKSTPFVGDFYMTGLTCCSNYHNMSKQISCATTVLEDSATAAAEIDRVLLGESDVDIHES
jgi:pyruvate decarboxylase